MPTGTRSIKFQRFLTQRIPRPMAMGVFLCLAPKHLSVSLRPVCIAALQRLNRRVLLR